MEGFSKRLEHIFSHFKMTSSQFADTIGVQKSNISHILSERNKPSLDFILKIREAFPAINLYWLIYGTEPFLTGDETAVSENKKEVATHPYLSAETREKNSDILYNEVPAPVPEISSDTADKDMVLPAKDSKTAAFVMLFYTDGTFEKFESR